MPKVVSPTSGPRERAEEKAERDESQRDAGERRKQRGTRRDLADALGDEGQRQFNRARAEGGEESRLPGDARGIGRAGLNGQHLRRQHHQEHVRDERDGIDAVRQRADVGAAGALG